MSPFTWFLIGAALYLASTVIFYAAGWYTGLGEGIRITTLADEETRRDLARPILHREICR
jgi:hypothetical protein